MRIKVVSVNPNVTSGMSNETSATPGPAPTPTLRVLVN
jgi:hypothetical protein